MRLKLIKEEEDKYSIFTKFAEQGSQRAVTEAEAVLQWIKRSGSYSQKSRSEGILRRQRIQQERPRERMFGGKDAAIGTVVQKRKERNHDVAVCEELITVANAEAGAKEVNNGGYVKPRSGKQDRIENGGSYGVLKAIDDAISIMNRLREPLQDPPQTTASSGTGNGKIRYRSPSSPELMESGTAAVSSSGHHSPSHSSESHQGLLSVDGGKTTAAKRGIIGRHESLADKIQRHRGILLLISVPVVLIGLVLLLVPGRSTSDAVVEEYTVLNRKGGPNSRPPKNYAVIFDAGSSGSRLKPGLSAYPTDPRQAANSLVSLLDKAEASVPRELRPKTPVRVGATAGLRTLGHEASENILQAVKELLRDRSMLKTEANAVTVLDGTQEGAYQWVTINYLLRNLGKPYSDTVGVVDLGGGSVQMAYAISEEDAATAPKPLEGEDSYVRVMYLKGRKYFLYVHSYLHYGLLAARAEILKVSEDSNSPCIVTGYDGIYKYGGEEFKAAAVQSGPSLDECRRLTINALKVNDTLCTHMKCTFGGVWNGGRGGGQKNMFVASFFFDRAAEAGFVDPKQPVATVRPMDFEKAAKKACSMKMEEGKSKFPRVEEDNLPYLCMDLVYQYTLLVDGFGLEPSQTITLVKKVKYGEHAVEAAWPLGSAIEAVSSPKMSLNLSGKGKFGEHA
ncbi:hypothetical protein Bca101_016521 [Brassica carinata]